MKIAYVGEPTQAIHFDKAKKRFGVWQEGRWRSVKGVHAFISRYFNGWHHKHNTGSGRNHTGMVTGAEVDEQVTSVTNWFYRRYPAFSIRNDGEGIPGRLDNGGVNPDIVRWGLLRDKLHKYTRSLFVLLEENNLRPHASQVHVGSKSLNIATAIDLLCIDTTRPRSLVVVEIKTGYNGYLLKSTRKMKSPFDQVDNHPLNQHRLQAAVTELLFRKAYTGVGRFNAAEDKRIDVRSVVAVINRDGCALYDQIPHFTYTESVVFRERIRHDMMHSTSNTAAARKRSRAKAVAAEKAEKARVKAEKAAARAKAKAEKEAAKVARAAARAAKAAAAAKAKAEKAAARALAKEAREKKAAAAARAKTEKAAARAAKKAAKTRKVPAGAAPVGPPTRKRKRASNSPGPARKRPKTTRK